MRLLLLWLVLSLGVFTGLVFMLPRTSPAALSMVLVETEEGYGSAFAIGHVRDVTVFLTAKHCVHGATQVTLDGHPAIRVEENPDLDVALVWSQFWAPALPLDFGEARPEERARAMGFVNESLFITEGLFSARNHASAPTTYGCSGGAMLRGGYAIGVVKQIEMIHDYPMPNFGVFVPLADAEEWIRGLIYIRG